MNRLEGMTVRNAGRVIDLSTRETVNQTQAHSRMTDRYAFIPTSTAVNVLRELNWHPVNYIERRARDESKLGFQKHIIAFRRLEDMHSTAIGSIPQLLLTNSHNGESAFGLQLGIFELVCSNGLIVAREMWGRMAVRHVGYADTKMESAVNTVAGYIPEVMNVREQWNNIKLTNDEQSAFASAVIDLRWDGETYSVNPQALLRVRHRQQSDPNLWDTFNVVQENTIKGGVPVTNVKARKVQKSREVKGIDANVKLNKALWTLAEKMAELKG